MQTKQFIQACLVERDSSAPVEALQCAFLFKPGLVETGLDGNLLSSFGFVAENEFEELGVIKLLATSEGQTVWQGVYHRAQLQPFQRRFQFGSYFH